MRNSIKVDKSKKITAIISREGVSDGWVQVAEYNPEFVGQYYNEQTGEITPEPPTNESTV